MKTFAEIRAEVVRLLDEGEVALAVVAYGDWCELNMRSDEMRANWWRAEELGELLLQLENVTPTAHPRTYRVWTPDGPPEGEMQPAYEGALTEQDSRWGDFFEGDE